MSLIVECREATVKEILEHSRGKRVRYRANMSTPRWATVIEVQVSGYMEELADGTVITRIKKEPRVNRGSATYRITADFYKLESGTTFCANYRLYGTKNIYKY